MSNHLAIATVTAALQKTLQASVQNHVEGARVTTVSPSEVSRGTPETGVNIFMYQVITNPALHNIDSIPMRAKNNAIKRQAALDLYYMLSFYGNNTELTPQRLLGSVVRTLNDRRVMTKEMIRDACQDTTFSFLRESDLADQVQQINIMPLDLNLEDLSKTWSVFFQTPYILSVAYKSLVVLLESEEVSERALPVRDRRSGGTSPFRTRPTIERVVAQAGRTAPILAESTLLIQGRQLKGTQATRVRIGGEEFLPVEVSSTQVMLDLAEISPTALRAGVQSLQIVHPPALAGVNDSPGYQGMVSAAAPFVLRPKVTAVAVIETDETDEGLWNATVSVEVNLMVGAEQKVVLAINQWRSDLSADDQPVNYLFDAPRRQDASQRLSISLLAVQAGEYIVRLLVDDAESQLEIDDDENSATYQWYVGPRISIA